MASLAVPDSIVRVSLREGGPSAPLVFIHGFLGGPRSFDALARASAHRGEVVGLRLPGHGLEPWGVGLTRPEDALNELAAAIPKEGAHLVGYSMGGRVALSLAALVPERVRSLLVVGAHAGLSSATERAARAATDAQRAEALRAHGVAPFVDAWEQLPIFASQTRFSPEKRASLRAERLAHTASGLAASLELLSAGTLPPVAAALGALGLAVRVVVGSLDPTYLAHARTLMQAIPSIDVIVVQGVGHSVVFEAPDDLVALVDLTVAQAERQHTQRDLGRGRSPIPGAR